MACVRPLGCLVVASVLLVACGRLGFEPRERRAEPTQPDDAGTTREPDDAMVLERDAAAQGDAGESGKDKLPEPPGGDGDMAEAGVLPFEPDGSVADAGGLGTAPDGATGTGSTFACSDYPDALACNTFDDAETNDWYLNGHRDGDTSIHDGYLDTRTYGESEDAYANASFDARYGGTLYFRMRVMFPSDGDLTSVNFLTVGNYESSDDYGVELDAVDGRLAFNSSRDGFTYSDFVLARDQWLCIDADLTLDSYDGSIDVRVDTVPALSEWNVDTVPNAGTALAHVGIDWTRRGQNYGHVLVDEFVISRSPVTCP